MTDPLQPSHAIDLSAARTALFRRQVRALVWLCVRIVLIAMLTATLTINVPWLRERRWLLDMGGGVLALWPLWSDLGKNWAWRIKLGAALLEAGRFADAEDLLRPLDGIQGALFDANGEGKRLLAAAREKKKESK